MSFKRNNRWDRFTVDAGTRPGMTVENSAPSFSKSPIARSSRRLRPQPGSPRREFDAPTMARRSSRSGHVPRTRRFRCGRCQNGVATHRTSPPPSASPRRCRNCAIRRELRTRIADRLDGRQHDDAGARGHRIRHQPRKEPRGRLCPQGVWHISNRGRRRLHGDARGGERLRHDGTSITIDLAAAELCSAPIGTAAAAVRVSSEGGASRRSLYNRPTARRRAR